MKFLPIVLLAAASLAAQAQQTRLNGYPYAPDERLLHEYWEGFHLAKPSPAPTALRQRAPVGDEVSAVEAAQRVFRTTSAKAMALVDGDQVVWSAYKEPATPATRLTGYSMGKTVTSMAVGKAICEGKLSLDTRAGDLLPELRDTAYGPVTVRHLLTQSSGIRDGSYYAKGTPQAREKIRQIEKDRTAGWREMLAIVNQPRTTVFGKPYVPGETFEYKESDPLVLGLMVQAATGDTLARYIEAQVLAGAGTAHEVALRQDRFGTTYAPTVARMVLEDWIRFAVWIKKSGAEPGCFGDYVRAATRTQIANHDTLGRFFGGYGYLMWTENIRQRDSYGAMGFGGQNIGFNPRNARILVVFSQIESDIDEYYKLYRQWSNVEAP